jgi:hypothetical protein
MARGKKEQAPVLKMKKPKWKVGDIVPINFLGDFRVCKIIELKRNPLHIERWVYQVVDINSNTIIPYVGVDGSEKFANIIEEIIDDSKE